MEAELFGVDIKLHEIAILMVQNGLVLTIAYG